MAGFSIVLLNLVGAVLLGILGVLAAVWLAGYILGSLGLSRMAQNAGMPRPWLAWIPIARDYLLGGLCDRAVWVWRGKRRNFAVLLPVLSALAPALGMISLTFLAGSLYAGEWISTLASLASLASLVVSCIALFHLWRDYSPGNEAALTVVSVLFHTLAPAIILFVLRNRVPFSVTGPGWQSQPKYNQPGSGIPAWGPTPPGPGAPGF